MDLNDKEWEIIEPLLPELPSGERGRPWLNRLWMPVLFQHPLRY